MKFRLKKIFYQSGEMVLRHFFPTDVSPTDICPYSCTPITAIKRQALYIIRYLVKRLYNS